MAGRSLRGAKGDRAYRLWVERIAANVRRLRSAEGWTQEVAAAECDLSARQFQNIEAASKNLTLTTLSRLSAGFVIDPLELVTAVDPTSPFFAVAPPQRVGARKKQKR